MTKKDYIMLARAIARCRPEDPAQLPVFDALVASLSRALREDNPNFDSMRFIMEAVKP